MNTEFSSRLIQISLTHCDTSTILQELQALRTEVHEISPLKAEIEVLRPNVIQLQQASFGSRDANVIPPYQTKTASDVPSNPKSSAEVTRNLHSSGMADKPT